MRIERAHAAQQQEKGQHARRTLCNKCCPGHACNIPVKHRDKNKVEHHVAHRGDDQQDQWCAAVPHGVENARAHVVQKQEQQAEYVYAQVKSAVIKNVRRGLERRHNAIGRQRADQREQQRDDRGADERGRNRGLHAQVPFGAEQLGDQHACADVHTGCHGDKQLGDRVACSDGGERKLTRLGRDREAADDHGVGHLVKLLERDAQQKRQRKPEQLFGWFAFGKVGSQWGFLLSENSRSKQAVPIEGAVPRSARTKPGRSICAPGGHTNRFPVSNHPAELGGLMKIAASCNFLLHAQRAFNRRTAAV